MQHTITLLAIGVVIAILDIVPMIIKKLDAMFIISACAMWVIFGILLQEVHFTSYSWINGVLLAMLLLIPLLPLIFRLDKAALIQVIITTVIFGAIGGYLSGIIA